MLFFIEDGELWRINLKADFKGHISSPIPTHYGSYEREATEWGSASPNPPGLNWKSLTVHSAPRENSPTAKSLSFPHSATGTAGAILLFFLYLGEILRPFKSIEDSPYCVLWGLYVWSLSTASDEWRPGTEPTALSFPASGIRTLSEIPQQGPREESVEETRKDFPPLGTSQ